MWFNQAWLADRLVPGMQVRLRGNLRGREFAVRSYDLDGVSSTADFAPVYPATEEVTVKKLREVVGRRASVRRDVVDPLPAALKASEGLPGRADALVALHRPAGGGRRRACAPPPGLRRAADAPARSRTAPAGPRGGARDGARRARRADRPVSGCAPVPADSGPGAGDRGDRRRPRRRATDGAAPAGGRRLGEDGRRPLCAAARRRGRAPRCPDGADGDTRRAALLDDRADLPRAGPVLRAADELRGRTGPAGGAERADRRRHPRVDPGGGRAVRSGGGRRGRAAPVRGRAAGGDQGGTKAAYAPHDGDADPDGRSR